MSINLPRLLNYQLSTSPEVPAALPVAEPIPATPAPLWSLDTLQTSAPAVPVPVGAPPVTFEEAEQILEQQLASQPAAPPAPVAQPDPPAAPAPAPKPAAPSPAPKPEPKPAPKPAPKPTASSDSPWKPGKGQLQGADTSHYQSDSTFQQTIKNSEFSVIKASQGTTYVDPTFKSRWAELGKKVESGDMTLRMAYVFLNKGDGKGQAKHFLDTVGVDGPLPAGTRLVLDWEADALSSPQTLKDAAEYIHKVTGTWPLIYVQGSKESVAKATVPEAPIWRAAWSSHIGTDVPFVQYSDGPNYDHDVFNGDKAALRRFAGYVD